MCRIKLFLLSVLCLFSACTSNKNLDTEYVKILSPQFFTEDSFEVTIPLQAKVFNNSIISHVARIGLCDSLLWGIDASYVVGTLVRCYSTSSQACLGETFVRGQGPAELLSAANIDMSSDSLTYWTYDVTKQRWIGRPSRGLSHVASLPKLEDCRMINLRDSLLPGISNPMWLENKFVYNSLFRYKERFFICDTATMSRRPVSNPSLVFKDKLNDAILADMFSTNLCVDDSRSYVILAGRYLDLIEIYDKDGQLVNMLKGPRKGFDFEFDVESSNARSALVKNPDSRKAYLAVKSTGGKIYALYSGKTKSDKSHYSYGQSIYVFSLDGNFLQKLVLDTPIIDFAVDIKRKRMYGISENAEIVYFELSVV